MRKLFISLLFLPGISFASYQPVTGSTIVVQAANNNTTAIPVSGTFFQTTQPVSISNSTMGVVGVGNFTLVPSTFGAVEVGSWSLAANQSVNEAQINGVTPLMGNGATGTGSQRITVSNDNTGISNWGQGATGSAVPAGAQYQGGIAKTSLPSAASDGNMVGSLRDKFGRTVSIGDCPRDLIISTSVALTASTSETVLLSSGTSGVFNDLVSMVVSNSGSTAALVTVRDNGNGTSSVLHFFAPATDTRGAALPHIWPQRTSASNWTVQSSASTSSIYVDAVFCQNK